MGNNQNYLMVALQLLSSLGLKTENLSAVNNHEYDYAVGTLYVDMINELEKLGDYVVNVVEARFGRA